VLAAAPAAAAPARGRVRFELPTGWNVEADVVNGDLGAQPAEFEATGRVVLTGPRGTMTAPRVTGQHDSKRGLIVARASGGVRVETVPENGRSIVARGQDAVYEPPQDRVTLTGGTEVVMTSPQLAEPAHLVGDRAVVQLKGRTATVYRTPAARVQLTLRPKREPAPIELTADQVSYDGAADRVTATGRPVMKNSQGTLTADRIAFDLAPGGAESAIVTAHADGNVVVDAEWKEPNAQTIHATGRQATYVRAQDEITLQGDVAGTVLQPGSPKPTSFSGDRMTLNLKTRRLRMGGTPAQVRTIPPARQSPSGATPAGGKSSPAGRRRPSPR
jgi:lipopolysaccharide transport protein LptA